ncbi:MAG: creatininase family protein [Nitrososphaeraceae archaeon]
MKTSISQLSDIEIRNIIKNKSIKTAIVPIGSLEQHGEHLPVSTDSLIADYISKKISEKIPVFNLPVISYGISFEHEPLFNISIKNNTLSNFIGEICISLSKVGIKNIILLNCHHGNSGILQYIHQNIRERLNEGSMVNFINYWHLIRDFDHAGEIETSLVLAIDEKIVNMKKVKRNKNDIPSSKVLSSSITNIPGSFLKITGNGVWGDPTRASKTKGKKLFNVIIRELVKIISEFERYCEF